MNNENSPMRPQLRYVDVFPVPGEQGRRAFGIRDPQRVSDKILRLQAEAAYALQFFDGRHTLPEIGAAYREKYGIEFPLELLEQLCRLLDEGYFLVSDNFEDHYRQLVMSFRQAPVREAFHAGVSYDENPAALNEALDRLFAPPAGPGLPGARDPKRTIPGIVVPHIDLRLGGPAYAWAYKELAESEPPELFVILGTGHNVTRNPYVLTQKRFATPLGEVPVDTEFISASAGDPRRRTLRGRTRPPLRAHHRVPGLVHPAVVRQRDTDRAGVVLLLLRRARRRPAGESIERFIDGLRTMIAEDERRICLIASADLAHVGPRYGDAGGFSGEDLEAVKRADLEMLRHVEEVDAEGFRGYLEQESDRRRICGFSPIYTMLKSMQAERGRVVAHDHGEMDPIGSICSFASVVFE